MNRNRIITIAVALVLAWVFGTDQFQQGSAPSVPAGNGQSQNVGPDQIAVQSLPPQAQQVLQLIWQGGPFPYQKDGTVFQNREKRLPNQKRGYYREYTVKTPGASNRGARRIVAGGNDKRNPLVLFYTDDHYRSFRQIVGANP